MLVEWPDRAAGFLPPDRLDVGLTLAPKLKLEFRHARVTGYGSFGPRVDRLATVRQFIAESGYSDALRARVQGDASTRSYERLALADKHVILMNSPRRSDGPPVRDGKPYSAIAHWPKAFCRSSRSPMACGDTAFRRLRSITPISTRAC